MQYVRGASAPSGSGAPSAMFVPPVQRYLSAYYYSNWYGTPNFTHFVIAVINQSVLSSVGGPIVEGVQSNATGWTALPGSTLVTQMYDLSRFFL